MRVCHPPKGCGFAWKVTDGPINSVENTADTLVRASVRGTRAKWLRETAG